MSRLVTALQHAWSGLYSQCVAIASSLSTHKLLDLPLEVIHLVIEALYLDQDVSTLKSPRTGRLLLRTVAREPILATQIKHLHVKLWTDRSRGGLSLRDRVDILESLPLHVRQLSTHGSLPKLLANGDHDAETAVLIVLAVNVESLILQTFVEDDKAPTHSSSDLALATFAHLTAHGRFPHLQHLHLIHREGYSRPEVTDLRAQIGSLHHRALDKLIVEDGSTPKESWFEQDPGASPKLRSLDLGSCKMRADAAARAICSFTGLKELTFSCISYYYRGGYEDWGEVFDILPTHAETLESLRVVAYEPVSSPELFAWPQMVALKKLTITSELLLFSEQDVPPEDDALLSDPLDGGTLTLPPILEVLDITTSHRLLSMRRTNLLPAVRCTPSMHTLKLHFIDDADIDSVMRALPGIGSLRIDEISFNITSEMLTLCFHGRDWECVSRYCKRAQESGTVLGPFLEGTDEPCIAGTATS
ncbi:hypothetical protein LTR95_006034 [Oleoguttula sp. CCFEE 5521]